MPSNKALKDQAGSGDYFPPFMRGGEDKPGAPMRAFISEFIAKNGRPPSGDEAREWLMRKMLGDYMLQEGHTEQEIDQEVATTMDESRAEGSNAPLQVFNNIEKRWDSQAGTWKQSGNVASSQGGSAQAGSSKGQKRD